MTRPNPRDLPLIKVNFSDLRRMGIVSSRYDLHQKIKKGRLPPPNKDGDRIQSAAWWWWEDIGAALERERAAQAAAE